MAPTSGRAPTSLRERRRTETTDHIVEVARQLFAERGYAATRTTDIADEAGVSHATLFRYFDAKAAIALHGITQRIDHNLDLLTTQPSDLSPLDATRAAFANAVGQAMYASDDPVVAELGLILKAPELVPELHNRINATAHRLATLLARRAGRDAATLADRVTAQAIIGAVQAASATWFEGSTTATPAELLDEAFAQLTRLR